MELYDEEGNPVAAYTEDELEAAKSQTAEEYQALLAEKEQELEAEREKEKNFSELRNQNKELTKAQTKEELGVSEKITKLEQQVEETRVAVSRDNILDDLSGGDDELRAKIAENYVLINKPETTKDEIKARALDAYTLSVGVDAGVLGSRSAAPAGPGRSVGAGAGANEELAELGRKFGINDEDWTKYSKN